MPWHRKHLLTIEDLKRSEIEQVLATAGAFRRILDRKVKKVPALRGKTIVNLFLEPSTRTRISFEMAAKLLSAEVISFDAASSSTTKGETLRDTAQNIQALVISPWLLIPSVAVIVAVLAFNFMGDGIRDAADPYL